MDKPKVEDYIRTEYVNVSVTHKLRKDLQKHEEICQDCKGIGVKVNHAHYGLTVDGVWIGDRGTPFDKESIIWCHNCYNGVRKRCEFCNELIDKKWVYCQCDKSLESRGKSPYQIEKKKWSDAIKLKADDEIAKSMGMYYSDYYLSNNGYFSDMEEFIEYWEDNHDEDEEKPKYVWATSSINLSLDAGDIVSNACEDLHEEAYSNIGDKDIKELQDYLDKWVEKQSGTITYYEDNKYAIEIPW